MLHASNQQWVAGTAAVNMSVCGPAGHDPLLGLAGDPGNKLEVRVVVENGEVSSLSDGGDKGVDDAWHYIGEKGSTMHDAYLHCEV
jgi:hypothetical protein